MQLFELTMRNNSIKSADIEAIIDEEKKANEEDNNRDNDNNDDGDWQTKTEKK